MSIEYVRASWLFSTKLKFAFISYLLLIPWNVVDKVIQWLPEVFNGCPFLFIVYSNFLARLETKNTIADTKFLTSNL